MKQLLYDEEEYSSLTSGFQVFFVSFTFCYEKCGGRNCGNCRNNGLALEENPFADQKSILPQPESRAPDCFFCNRSGKCSTCDGDGRYEVLNGTIWGSRCGTCDGNGKCAACGGDGVMGS